MALPLDHTKKQWVDLEIQPETCMARMDCGEAGGAVSMWIRVISCPVNCGIISSHVSGNAGLFMILPGSEIV